MTIEYLYDPAAVEKILRQHPSLCQKLGSLTAEGEKALSFPRARKTGREIYRILSNQQYPHLVELLRTLDYCIGNGYEQPTLLKTRAQKDFESSLADLFAAEFFLKRDLKVTGLDAGKGTISIPDMLVESDALSLSVEVYCPREWDGLDCFLDELRLGMLHLDIPWDFCFEVNMGVMDHFDPGGKLLWFDPWKFSEEYEKSNERWTKIKPVLSKIETELGRPTRPKIVEYLRDERLNVLIEIRLCQIEKNQEGTPVRCGTIAGPTLTGYAPEGMFDQLIRSRVLKKLRKGQAQALPGILLRALIVDVSKLGYNSEFEHPWYLQQFGESIRRHLNPDVVDVEMVIFCLPRSGAGNQMAIPLLFRKTSCPEDAFVKLFGGDYSFNAVSAEVSVGR